MASLSACMLLLRLLHPGPLDGHRSPYAAAPSPSSAPGLTRVGPRVDLCAERTWPAARLNICTSFGTLLAWLIPLWFTVHPMSEVRARLSGILARLRRGGAAAGPVAFGSHRKPEAVLTPYEAYERYEALARQRARLDGALSAAQSVQVELPGAFSAEHDREVSAYVDGEMCAARSEHNRRTGDRGAGDHQPLSPDPRGHGALTRAVTCRARNAVSSSWAARQAPTPSPERSRSCSSGSRPRSSRTAAWASSLLC